MVGRMDLSNLLQSLLCCYDFPASWTECVSQHLLQLWRQRLLGRVKRTVKRATAPPASPLAVHNLVLWLYLNRLLVHAMVAHQ